MSDYGYWLKMSTWTLDEAVNLVLGINPAPNYNSYEELAANAAAILLKGMARINGKTKSRRKLLLELAKRKLKLNKIGSDENTIIPSKFIQWAETIGYNIPKEFKAIASKYNKKRVEKPQNIPKIREEKYYKIKNEIISLYKEEVKKNPDLKMARLARSEAVKEIIQKHGKHFKDTERTVCGWIRKFLRAQEKNEKIE